MIGCFVSVVVCVSECVSKETVKGERGPAIAMAEGEGERRYDDADDE